jgi:ribonuclease J
MLFDDDRGRPLLVDAGASFSDLETFGVGYEVPDFARLGERVPDHVILTHAHDDHAKALFLLRDAAPAAEVWGTRATLARAAAALGDARTGELEGGRPIGIGRFAVDVLPVSHSIPGTVMVRLRTEQGSVVIATDFRLAAPAIGTATDLGSLARWGAEGVDVALLDSTNATVSTEPPAEATIAAALAEQVRRATGMVVAVTFASHTGRFHQLVAAAVAAGRVVVPVGRGLLDMLAVERGVGSTTLPTGAVRPLREAGQLPRDRLLVVATGSQGETGSAFARLAVDLLAELRLRAGDTVLHAARVIPGSERRLANLFDHCARRGARVVTASDAPIHASGHAHRAELDTVLELLRPRQVLPVHGRRRHLEAQAELARAHGVRTLVVENGEEVEWGADGLAPTGQRRGVGRILIDDVGEEVLDPGVLLHRRVMAQEGLVVAVLPLPVGGEPSTPHLHAHGLALDAATRQRLAVELRAVLCRGGALAGRDPDWLRSTMASWLRRELRRRARRRPAVIALVTEP